MAEALPDPARLLPAAVVDAGYGQARQTIGRFNLGLFGLTGVGKSTLLNAVFGAEIARTGIGDPVTQGSRLYRHDTSTLGIFDTKGLEIGDDSRRILGELRRFVDTNRLGHTADQIHVIWYCIRAGDRRIQPAEEEFVRQVAGLGIPVLLAVTQTPLDAAGQLHADARALAASIDERRLPTRGPVYFVNAKGDDFGDTPAHGLDVLLDATAEVAPEGVRSALAAAQQVNRRQKRVQAGLEIDRAERRVSARVFLRGLGTQWAELFAAIAGIYGMPEDRSRAVLADAAALGRLRRMLRVGNSGLLVIVVGPATAIALGRKIVRRFAKDDDAGIPVGWQDVEGDPQRAEKQRIGTGFAAGQVTRALGESWMETCEHFWATSFPEPPSYADQQEIANRFADELHDRLPRMMRRWETRAAQKHE